MAKVDFKVKSHPLWTSKEGTITTFKKYKRENGIVGNLCHCGTFSMVPELLEMCGQMRITAWQ
jgi:hypothetical protein